MNVDYRVVLDTGTAQQDLSDIAEREVIGILNSKSASYQANSLSRGLVDISDIDRLPHARTS